MSFYTLMTGPKMNNYRGNGLLVPPTQRMLYRYHLLQDWYTGCPAVALRDIMLEQSFQGTNCVTLWPFPVWPHIGIHTHALNHPYEHLSNQTQMKHWQLSVWYNRSASNPWWRHQMETFPRYWPFVRGIHRSRWSPRTKASDVYFDLRRN